MKLPEVRRKPKRDYPKNIVLYGPQKVGKTSLLSKLDNALFIDTERGTELLEVMDMQASSLTDVLSIRKALIKRKKEGKTYDYIIIDTIDNIVAWLEQKVVSDFNKDHDDANYRQIGDIPYGSGYNEVRNKMIKLLHWFEDLTDRLVIVAHRKRSIIGTDKVEVDSSTLDLTGKLKNFLTSDVDAIGFVYREEDLGKTLISFKTNDSLDSGTRVKRLAGKIIDGNDIKHVFDPEEDVTYYNEIGNVVDKEGNEIDEDEDMQETEVKKSETKKKTEKASTKKKSKKKPEKSEEEQEKPEEKPSEEKEPEEKQEEPEDQGDAEKQEEPEEEEETL